MKKQHYVYACSFFYALGGNILNLTLVFHLADRFGFSPAQIGIYFALGQFSFFMGCNLYHRFGAALDPIRVFPFAALVAFLASLPLGLAKAPFLIYAAYWLLQMAGGFHWPPMIAWLNMGLKGQELSRTISLFNRSWILGNILGPLISGFLYRYSSGATFFILGLSYFLAVLIYYRLNCYSGVIRPGRVRLRRERSSGTIGAAEAGEKLQPGALDKKTDIYRYQSWIGSFCSNVFLGFLVNIVPLHIRDGLGHTEQSAGLILFFRCVVGFAAFVFMAKFTGWHFNRRWILIPHGILILLVLLFFPAGSRLFFYFVIAIVYGFLNSTWNTSSIFYSSTTGRNPRKNLAIYEISISLGNGSGSVAGGFFYQQFRFGGSCLALFLIMGLGMGLLVFLDRKISRISALSG